MPFLIFISANIRSVISTLRYTMLRIAKIFSSTAQNINKAIEAPLAFNITSRWNAIVMFISLEQPVANWSKLPIKKIIFIFWLNTFKLPIEFRFACNAICLLLCRINKNSIFNLIGSQFTKFAWCAWHLASIANDW